MRLIAPLGRADKLLNNKTINSEYNSLLSSSLFPRCVILSLYIHISSERGVGEAECFEGNKRNEMSVFTRFGEDFKQDYEVGSDT